jgi:hypothetical protein
MSENVHKSKEIELAIAETIAFLDIFDYSPTNLEIWRLLGVKAELESIVIPTESRHSGTNGGIAFTFQNNYVASENGSLDFARDDKTSKVWSVGVRNSFYFLPGREEIVNKRSEFFHLAERKYRIARRAAAILGFVPGVRMVAVCNNFYYREESDIDLFIVAEKGMVWTVRFLATVLLDLFRLRARGDKTSDRVCLSFYTTTEAMNLEGIALSGGDPYLYHWLAFLEPIFDDGIGESFWSENFWIKKHMPNFWPTKTSAEKMVGDGRFTKSVRALGSVVFGAWFEALAKKIQFKKVSKRFSGSGVVINDTMLKFHENDRRAEFREKLRIKKEELRIN